MAKIKSKNRKAKRKAKLNKRRNKLTADIQKERAEYFFHEALWYWDQIDLEKALTLLMKALRYDPRKQDILEAMVDLGFELERQDVMLKGLLSLYNIGKIKDERLIILCEFLAKDKQYELALEISEQVLDLLPEMKIRNKRKKRSSIINLQQYCRWQLEFSQKPKRSRVVPPHKPPSKNFVKPAKPPSKNKPLKKSSAKAPLPQIPISIEVETASFTHPFSRGHLTSNENYNLTLEGYQIRFKESFENLICLVNLQGVRSLWYQEETARKVLKRFRGRALLSDEVGLGKTIEASIVLKEYIQRGMVKSALILTPTSLVSQWKEELREKFGLDFPSTDDPDCRSQRDGFWQKPFVLASINLAKSRKNFSQVTEREYDMVIVDEAHHLKNRSTLNWKLVNALKKRFLLLLTATPVENNLMELYNLITLLKPGQLKTSSEFRKEFMTQGDPTDPQNRRRLKTLLGEVMIRNTRALANLGLPPRFAHTIRVDPSRSEKELYERITGLVQDVSATDGTGRKLLLKNLLAKAGSSPYAVNTTLSRMLSKKDLLLDHQKKIQAINNLCRSMNDTRKSRMLLELIRSSSEKIIIFVKYLGTLEHLSDFLSWNKIPHALFHGGLNNRSKDEQINRFKEEANILLTTEIGGEGRNLQFCHQMINYDLPWNPMKIEQRIGRIHRIGQDKEVTIYNLCAAGSAEDYILEVLDKKINMFELVIGEIDMILGRVRGEKEFSDMVYDIWIQSVSEAQRKKGFDQLATRLKRSKAGYEKTKALDEKLFGENYEL
ncbi:MAG: SNF2-related protein [Desulfobacterales bacterium]|jgi:SNF2 family DNA or RNA helicase